jgi:hypothetical protein
MGFHALRMALQEGSFLNQCLVIFGDNEGYAVWEAVNNFFDTLPLAASIDGKPIFVVILSLPSLACIHTACTIREAFGTGFDLR